MKREKISLWEAEEYTYKTYGEFLPNITTYCHEEGEYPSMLIVPGGGYERVSPSEGEVVALEFYEKGYNTFVLTYTTNVSGKEPLERQPLWDLAKGVVAVKEKKKQPVILCGFSAGAHLCASLLAYKERTEKELSLEKDACKAAAAILCYPVITSGAFGHRASFEALYGKSISEAQLRECSLEYHVRKGMPPVFLWATVTDNSVPVENSYFFSKSLQEVGIPFEMHIFGNGPHGLSLATKEWADGEYEGFETLQPVWEYLEYCRKEHLPFPKAWKELEQVPAGTSMKEALIEKRKMANVGKEDKGIAMWTTLAQIWLEKLKNASV